MIDHRSFIIDMNGFDLLTYGGGRGPGGNFLGGNWGTHTQPLYGNEIYEHGQIKTVIFWVFRMFLKHKNCVLPPVIAQWRAVASVSGAHLAVLQVSDQITLQCVRW